MSAPQGKKISLAGLEPHAAVEKGKKLLWKYEETRYFVSFLWSYISIILNFTKTGLYFEEINRIRLKDGNI